MPFDPDQFLQQQPEATPTPVPAAAPSFSPDVFLQGTSPLAGISAPAAPAPDKYEQAAVAERDRLLKANVRLPEGFTRRLASGPFLGWADELSAAGMTPAAMAQYGTLNPVEGYRYAKARENLASRATQEKTGTLGDIAETVGGLATLPGNVFGRQAAAALGGGGKGVLPAIARMAGYGAEAGTMGAIQGAGNAKTMTDIPEEALRGGALSGLLGAPFGAFAKVGRQTTAATPSVEELFRKGAQDYKARDKLPVGYDLTPVTAKLNDLSQAVINKYGRKAAPTAEQLNALAGETQGVVNAATAASTRPPVPPGTIAPAGHVGSAPWNAVAKPRDIADMRAEIYDKATAGSSSATNDRAATVASKAFDRILTRPDFANLAPGTDIRDAITAAMLQQRGRGNFAAGYRSKAVNEALDAALHTAGSQASGLNFENILRKNLDKAKKSDAFGALTSKEEPALENLITGTVKANRIRELGNMLGGGGGLGRVMAMGTGGAGTGAVTAYTTGQDPVFGAVAGLGLGLAGRGLRTYGNRQAQSGAEAFSDLLRQRSPEYMSRVAAAPTEIGPGLTSATARGLRQALTLGGGGDIRDAIAQALLYQATGEHKPPRIYGRD